MHPGGIKFGLSQDLLELRGADVVVSARFLENISAIARRWIRRRKRAMPQWEDIVGEALYSTPYSLRARRGRSTFLSIWAWTASSSKR